LGAGDLVIDVFAFPAGGHQLFVSQHRELLGQGGLQDAQNFFEFTHALFALGELEEILGILQPTLSQQLTVLRDEELVTTRREGKNIYYQIASPQALAVMNVLFDQFCGPNAGDNT